MSKIILDFVGGDAEKNKRIEEAMRKELAKKNSSGGIVSILTWLRLRDRFELEDQYGDEE